MHLLDISKFNERWWLAILGARICYSEDLDLEFKEDYYTDINKAFTLFNKLYKKGHLSPFEHIMFGIKNPPDPLVLTFMLRPGSYFDVKNQTMFINMRHIIELFKEDPDYILKTKDKYFIDTFESLLGIDDISQDKFTPPKLEKQLSDKVYVVYKEDDIMSVVFKGITRYTATQILRHRVFSYNQQSLRYTKLKIGPFIDKQLIIDNLIEKKKDIEEKEIERVLHFVNMSIELVMMAKDELDIPNEVLRSIFPLAIKTNLMMTGPIKHFKEYFIKPRIQKDAQLEIRQLAEQLNEYLKEG